MRAAFVTEQELQDLVLSAVRHVNQARTPEMRLEAAPGAPLFGPGSSLASIVEFLNRSLNR